MNRRDTFPLRRDLGSQILLFYLIFVGLVIGAVLMFENLAGRRLEADVNGANLALAHAVAEETSSAMDNALATVRELANLPEVIAADRAGMSTRFRTLMTGRQDVNLTYRLNAQGIMLFHYPEAPASTVGVDFSFRDYFQAALRSRDPLVSRGRISPTTSEPVATAVMPIWRGDTFRGLVATNMRLQSLSDALSSIAAQFQPAEGFQIFIVDAGGQIIAHSDPTLLLQDGRASTPAIIDAVLARQSGNQVGQDAGGAERLYSYVPIDNVGWGVVVSRPAAVAFATLNVFRRGALVALGVFLISGVLFWVALSRRVIQPLERLASFSQDIGMGEGLDVETHTATLGALTSRPDQMGLLTRSLTRMQEAIAARLNELSTLLETGAAVVSTLDPQDVLHRILEQAERLLGTDMSAVFALDEQQGVFRVYASRGLPRWYREQATINPDEPGSVTMRAIRSGQPIQIDDTETNPSFSAHRHRARAAGYRSVLAVPLRSQHTPPAALLVFRTQAHHFSPREINLLASFANHATMALENAALYARSDMRLQEQTRRLEALVQSMQDGLILENLDGRILYANRTIHELAHLNADDALGISAAALMARILAEVRDKDEVLAAIGEALQGGPRRRVQFAVDGPGGTRYWRLQVFDVTDADGTRIGRGRILRDVTQRYELDRMKSSLISTVSHELRTPLAAIKGYTSTLLADDVEWDSITQREFLDIISAETDHLSDLVSDLLDMSRIETGSLKVNRMSCDLAELVTQAAQRAHPRPDLPLALHLPPELPPLYADPRRIEAVLRNLIENARKYGGDAAPIRVEASQEDHQIVVRVRDRGPGIPPMDQQRIFDSFYRVDGGLTRRTSGAGLGLAISRGFVEAHGGRIWVEPQERGLCVAFSLPLMVEGAEVEALE